MASRTGDIAAKGGYVFSERLSANAPHEKHTNAAVHFQEEPEQIPITPSLMTESPVSAQDGQSYLEDIHNLSEGLQAASLQQERLGHFDYQPFSLPPSRVPSRDNSTAPNSPRKSMNSPPLTPASTHDRPSFRKTHSHEQRHAVYQTSNVARLPTGGDPVTMTPQTSPPRPSTLEAMTPKTPADEQYPRISPGSSRPVSAHSQAAYNSEPTSRHPTFTIGPADSAEVSPAGTPPGSGNATPFHPPSRPFTPAGEHDDPYARHKRIPQSKKPEEIEARFKFGKSRQHNHSTSSLTAHCDSKSDARRHSHLSLHSLGKHGDDGLGVAKKSSMDNLKRFFKGSHKKRTQSPGASSVHSSRSSVNTNAAPFSEDHGLNKKYGKFGKVLGSGAGGSVRLMKRSSDGVTFAVKEFRARHSYETEREYAKKVTAEFCIGSTLHHGNIIETLDIINEKGRWYEVMEYAPFDLFATVMTGKMSKEEVACTFMQIVNGLTFLHSMGLAHRDLKLDNVVINEHGILKIIDFGSASVFRYPFENGIVEAHGIVGSDPYLAPEVCNELKYDPQPADIWSLAIIFCCMTLRRFPWKAPRQSDNSFRLFASPPDPPKSEAGSIHSTTTAAEKPVSSKLSTEKKDNGSASNPAPSQVQGSGQSPMKGANRLLRLLPRESRHIIGRMLELNPKKRATLEEIWADEWIQSIEFCRQEPGHNIVRASNHTHVLEAQAPGTQEASRKSTK
ncbi:kinase-like domain-containing protein [Geopyxis carbonaria]|nr:kinase-like domain-containing protein [Geopyxis carbonaria]